LTRQNQFASIRTLSSIASGLTAGILGLENLWGFALYLASIVMGAMLVSGLQCTPFPFLLCSLATLVGRLIPIASWFPSRLT
jgi:C4-dicarboxylate transporter